MDNHGNTPILAVGKTAVSEHIASFDHSEGDIEYKILDFEWLKGLVKETIAISRLKLNLNDKEGIHISAIYDPIPTVFALETRSING